MRTKPNFLQGQELPGKLAAQVRQVADLLDLKNEELVRCALRLFCTYVLNDLKFDEVAKSTRRTKGSTWTVEQLTRALASKFAARRRSSKTGNG